MPSRQSFCGTPDAGRAFTIFMFMPALIIVISVLASGDWRPLSFLPVIFILYLWFFEDIPWRGRSYGYGMMPGGSIAYSGEAYDCYACKHIRAQLDCTYGCLVDPVKFAHKDDWRSQYPCVDCMRSGAVTEQDRYKGPVRWSEGERP